MSRNLGVSSSPTTATNDNHMTAPQPQQNSNSTKNGTNHQHPKNSPFVHCHNLLDKIFMNCSNDPVGNVHRTWSITLLMMVLYMIITVFQIMHLNASNRSNSNDSSSSSSPALLLACLWHGMMQFIMIGLMGTFIMKRFPTSFAIGFLFGMIIVFINQNIIYMITFTHYNHSAGDAAGSNSRLYSAFSLLLAIVLSMFGILLFHFQKYIIVAPIDAKGFNRSSSPTSTATAGTATKSSAPTTTYQRYDDGSEA